MADAVQLKGSGNGIVIHLAPDVAFSALTENITQKFKSNRAFFASGRLTISFTGRTLSEEEETALQDIIREQLGNEELSFVPYVPPTRDIAQVDFYGVKEGLTKFHQGLVRSGQLVASEGNLVVIGDANPGSELIAGGNVIVMGALRGIVHAGCKGNREAIVVALNLAPNQLRIADIFTRAPDDQVHTERLFPEMAFVKDDMIYIDDYLTKKRPRIG